VLPVNFLTTSVHTGPIIITFVTTKVSVGLTVLNIASLNLKGVYFEAEWLTDKTVLSEANTGSRVGSLLSLLKYYISVYNTMHIGNFVLPARQNIDRRCRVAECVQLRDRKLQGVHKTV